MSRPLLLIHGYSAGGLDFAPLCARLKNCGIAATDLNIGNYVSLNNEITIKDIAEGLDRALRTKEGFAKGEEFDAIVHSTGMLVLRSWLTNYGAAVGSNDRLKRLKHLIGLAPATWGSPQAHKGRTWLGALVKGNREAGPDFMNAGDEVLDGLELGSQFTWDLAHLDLLGANPYYSKGSGTPYVCIFIGNRPYEGLASVANDPGTDGTVRWAGCGLNTRKITIDLTRTPIGEDGKSTDRATITPWADERLDVPMIAVEGKNHASLISDPDDKMVGLIVDFLKVADDAGHQMWLDDARLFGAEAKSKMMVNPGSGAAGIVGEVGTYFGHLFGGVKVTEGWQQFVIHARDERGDSVTDYLVDILRLAGDKWENFEEMYTDVHAYKTDPSYRCFHVRLPKGICDGKTPLKIRIHASTGTELVEYQGYGSDQSRQTMTEMAGPVELEINDFGGKEGSLFNPFTTTLVEIVLNREPSPLNQISRLFGWWVPKGSTRTGTEST